MQTHASKRATFAYPYKQSLMKRVGIFAFTLTLCLVPFSLTTLHAQEAGNKASAASPADKAGFDEGTKEEGEQKPIVILPSTTSNPFNMPQTEINAGIAYSAYQQGYYLSAFALATRLAGLGETSAQTLLGQLYLHGQGIAQDSKQAANWFAIAADDGDPEAQFALGLLYARGDGVRKDTTKAFKLFEQAADKGQKNAQYNLALAYLQGLLVRQDFTRAMDLFSKAAKQGQADAQYALGNLFRSNYFPLPKLDEAAYWMRQAAQNGSSGAQLEYGLMVFKGQGVKQDYAAARSWITQAANAGNILAQNRLARILARGYGTAPDPVKAAYYYLLSKKEGKKDDWLENFYAQLPKTDKEKALRALSQRTLW